MRGEWEGRQEGGTKNGKMERGGEKGKVSRRVGGREREREMRESNKCLASTITEHAAL